VLQYHCAVLFTRYSTLAAGTVHCVVGPVHAVLFIRRWYCLRGIVPSSRGTVPLAAGTVHTVLFIHRCWFSTPCDHHAGRHRGRCPPCSARGHRQEGRGCRGAGRRCVQAARLLLEEESKAAALEQTATAACQRVPSSSSLATASQLVPTASSTYEDTVIAGLHL
jgi:hypothetical protein